MELTQEEAKKMLQERIKENPTVAQLVQSPKFTETLRNVLLYLKIDNNLYLIIENEILVVLALYAPFGELAQNISESTSIPIETAKQVVGLVDSLLLQPVHDELIAFEYHWNEELRKEEALPEASKETREKLELRPENMPRNDAPTPNNDGARPLTREEVLKALAPTRTMAKDIASIKEDAGASVHGYEAYQDLKKGSGE